MKRPNLIFFDMEGTLFKKAVSPSDTTVPPSVWLSIAKSLGAGALAEERETHNKWHKREYPDYIAWMEDTIAIHKKYGLRRSAFQQIIDGVPFTPGVQEVFQRLHSSGIATALITGGFKYQADKATKALKISHSFAACEYFWDKDDCLDHWKLIPSDYAGKVHFMKMLAEQYNITADECGAVGDGDNDIDLAESVGISIAFNATPALSKVADYCIAQDCGAEDFRAILPYLGL